MNVLDVNYIVCTCAYECVFIYIYIYHIMCTCAFECVICQLHYAYLCQSWYVCDTVYFLGCICISHIYAPM